MRKTRRTLTVAIFTGALMVASVASAFAAECYVANKPDGAGNAGDVIIDAATGEVVSAPTTPGGQHAGGFVDVYLDVDGDGSGDILLVNDTFLLPQGNPALGTPGVLPEGALHSGGDGAGIDHAGH